MGLHPGLERVEWAVFHGAVREALSLLDTVDGMDERSVSYGHWLRGVALGACARYGEALEVVDEISPGVPEYSMARSLRGSLLRQLGVHDLAAVADREAMGSAATPGAAIEAMTGLAADAVGLQDSVTASSTIAQAGSLLGRVSAASRQVWWRHQVRVEWVGCEIALLRSETVPALGHAQAALTLAEDANAPRHVAKSLLFVAVCQIENGELEQAIPNLRRCLMLCAPMDFGAVAWPAHAVLAALLKPTDAQTAGRHFEAADEITARIAAGLNGELGRRWRERADILALHREASEAASIRSR